MLLLRLMQRQTRESRPADQSRPAQSVAEGCRGLHPAHWPSHYCVNKRCSCPELAFVIILSPGGISEILVRARRFGPDPILNPPHPGSFACPVIPIILWTRMDRQFCFLWGGLALCRSQKEVDRGSSDLHRRQCVVPSLRYKNHPHASLFQILFPSQPKSLPGAAEDGAGSNSIIRASTDPGRPSY